MSTPEPSNTIEVLAVSLHPKPESFLLILGALVKLRACAPQLKLC
jgi:hypothetical protein